MDAGHRRPDDVDGGHESGRPLHIKIIARFLVRSRLGRRLGTRVFGIKWRKARPSGKF